MICRVANGGASRSTSTTPQPVSSITTGTMNGSRRGSSQFRAMCRPAAHISHTAMGQAFCHASPRASTSSARLSSTNTAAATSSVRSRRRTRRGSLRAAIPIISLLSRRGATCALQVLVYEQPEALRNLGRSLAPVGNDRRLERPLAVAGCLALHNPRDHPLDRRLSQLKVALQSLYHPVYRDGLF